MFALHINNIFQHIITLSEWDVQALLDALASHPKTASMTREWAHGQAKAQYVYEVREMASREGGWHFSAIHTDAERFKTFDIDAMAQKMAKQATCVFSVCSEPVSCDGEVD